MLPGFRGAAISHRGVPRAIEVVEETVALVDGVART